jgi:hypothetical protein
VDSPSVKLAGTIVERLVAEHLLSPEDAKKIQPRLAEGKLRPQDWRLPIELADAKGKSK